MQPTPRPTENPISGPFGPLRSQSHSWSLLALGGALVGASILSAVGSHWLETDKMAASKKIVETPAGETTAPLQSTDRPTVMSIQRADTTEPDPDPYPGPIAGTEPRTEPNPEPASPVEVQNEVGWDDRAADNVEMPASPFSAEAPLHAETAEWFQEQGIEIDGPLRPPSDIGIADREPPTNATSEVF